MKRKRKVIIDMAQYRPDWISDMNDPLPVAKVVEDGSVKIRLKNFDQQYTIEEVTDLMIVLERAKEEATILKEAMLTDTLYSDMIFGEISDV
jgi:hypothetical protein